MTPGAIRFDGVWKKFRRGERHDSLRDLVPALARAWAGAARRAAADAARLARDGDDGLGPREFWALRDVSFQVPPGEALGIIGPNGAGKSTILKILTRILKPTRGVAVVRGRTGALLEIGGSLHPDLTGRENVYLQGSIMGMRRVEIARKFDEIVVFAGLPDFIDTPVRHYSSGMSARLGFSVAAHLEADVLIIDEVLAVGDSAFQRKAFERMESLVGSGVPTVIVSHQLERVASLCRRAILLAGGRVAHHGPPADCIAAYARLQAVATAAEETPGGLRIDAVTLDSPEPVASGGTLGIRIAGRAPTDAAARGDVVVVRVRSLETGSLIFAVNTGTQQVTLSAGEFRLAVTLTMNVPAGMYAVECAAGQRTRERGATQGPSVIVRVSGGPSFWGSVQMNAAMTLLPTAGAAPGAGA